MLLHKQLNDYNGISQHSRHHQLRSYVVGFTIILINRVGVLL